MLTFADLNEFLTIYRPELEKMCFPKLNKSFEETAYDIYKEFIEIQKHESDIKYLLDELKQLTMVVYDLNQPQIQEWCARTKDLYIDKLFGFATHYFHFLETPNDFIYIQQLDVSIESKGLENIIMFCDVQKILCWGEYYLTKEHRKPANPNDYYYVQPDPNAPSDIDVVKQLLLL